MNVFRICGLLLLVVATSCNKFLDVVPVDRMLDQTTFSSRKTIERALIGLYIRFTAEGLYGGNLKCSYVDVLAQYYDTDELGNRFGTASMFKFHDDLVLSALQDTWNTGYRSILEINLFITSLKAVDPTIVPEEQKKLMLGEAYGLRAHLAFDMFRLYGPVYLLDQSAQSLPYPTYQRTEPFPLLKAQDFIQAVTQDLDSAKVLLADDPVITEGVVPIKEVADTEFYKMRNLRMNYYAVLALTARVKLYAGDKAGAFALAKEIIDRASPYFSWTPETASRPNSSSVDRLFSPEVIFGLDHPNRVKMYQEHFVASLAPSVYTRANGKLLAPTNEFLNRVFEQNERDYRLRSSWMLNTNEDKDFRTFFKYNDVNERNSNIPIQYRTLVPMIRMSELYLIGAECAPDKQAALAYLNALRENRGIPALTAAVDDLLGEITKEFRREFWGEGQLFFYYKRLQLESIDGQSGSVIMTNKNYVMPMPLTELSYR